MISINFTGSYLKTAYIPQKTNDGKTKSVQVSIVELNPDDKNDVKTLRQTAEKWERIRNGYALSIYNELYKSRNYNNVISEKYLALTTQNKNFDKLKPEKVLGLALYFTRMLSENEIAWLQSNPTTNYESENERKYTEIGKTLTTYMKEISDKPLFVHADKDAITFYEKQGFKAADKRFPSILFYEE